MSFAIAVCFRPEGESAATTAEHLYPWVRHFGVKQPHFMSDAEGLTKNIAARLADLCEGTEDSFAPERHAPAAERTIRTLKGIVATHELELREHGVVLDGECADVFDLLFQYAAHTHNRFSVSVGSTMTPMQKIRGDRPQVTYPFGAVAYAKITRARRPDADAKYARGIYLGPVLGSTGHAMEIRLDSGETKRVIAPGLKLLYPLRFDASLLPGAKALDGFVPPPEAPKTKELFLPYVPGGGPPIDWVRQHGVTPKCPGCQEGVSSSRHSQKCVNRYQKWLRDSIDDALEALDEGPKVDRRPEELIGEDPYDDDEQMKPNKRTRFGGEEVRAFDPEQAGVGDLEIPEMSVPDADWNVSEYQPSEAEDEDMGDALEHPQTFHEGVPVRYLEELLENAHYTPQPLSCCDHYDVEAACHLLVGRSSVEKFPYVCLSTTTQQQHHKQQQSVERETVELLNLQDHPCVCSSVKERKEDESAGTYMRIQDRTLWVNRPRASYDDLEGFQLDPEETWQGIKKEVNALDSLKVGYARFKSEIDEYRKANPNCRTVKSRWVLTQKAPGLVRARIVAKDFAHGRPSALDLGLSSNTASVEALKIVLARAAKGKMRAYGLDISTAFLFAQVVEPTIIELPSTFALESGETAYLILEKALYGLRSASLSWQRHLNRIVSALGLQASPLEPTLFSGWVNLESGWEYIIMLAYVDDLLIVSSTEKGFEYVHEALSSVLKVKVTGRLIEDGQMEFLGRLIRWDGRQIMLGVKPEYVKSVFTSFGWDISTVKASLTTPDIRSMYDEESVEEPSKELSSEAASRFRSCLGKIGWLCQTRSDITYFHSMLSRGQSMPRQVHEDALRKFLRWLAAFPLLDQIFPLGDGKTNEGENASLVAYCDSNWGSEMSVARKSTSGGVIYIAVDGLWYCIKGYSRLQSVVALSSAEAELFAIAEAAKEVAGLAQLTAHIWGTLQKPHRVYTDSASARQIASMEGLLRRMRHIDLRLCFIQDRVHSGELAVEGVAGTENVSDLLTKNLNRLQTAKHTATLGLEDVTNIDFREVPAVRSCLLLSGVLDSVLGPDNLEYEAFCRLCELETEYSTLLIEFCTSSRSNLYLQGSVHQVFVLPITQGVDGTSNDTVERVMSAMNVAREWGMKVVFWSSTPCTGGSPYQRRHEDRPGYQDHLQALFTVHRKLWRSFLVMVNHPQVVVWVIEWPQRCAYWGWASTRSFAKQRTHYTGEVHGCVSGLVGRDGLPIRKIWKLMSNDEQFVRTMSETFACTCKGDHSRNFDLKATQHYPPAFADVALESLRLR